MSIYSKYDVLCCKMYMIIKMYSYWQMPKKNEFSLPKVSCRFGMYACFLFYENQKLGNNFLICNLLYYYHTIITSYLTLSIFI